MFKKIKYWRFKKYKLKSITSYQWLVLDIGTENLKCKYINIGLKYSIPTYLAENYEQKIIFYGEDAKELSNKTDQNIFIKRPVRDGNIVDPDSLHRILSKIFQDFRLEVRDWNQINNIFVKKSKKHKKLEKNCNLIILMTTSNANESMKKFLQNIIHRLGAFRGFINEQVKMAALGSGQDIFGTAIMCVNIGSGITDVAIISNNSILYSYTTYCAGDYLILKIQEYINKKYTLKIEVKEAENILKKIGSLMKYEDEKPYIISNFSFEITPEEVRENVIKIQFRKHVIPAMRTVLRTTGNKAPSSISDLKKEGKGITICGGGAYIKKIDEFIKEELSKEYFIEIKNENCIEPIIQKCAGEIFEVRVAQNLLDNVIDGCAKYRDTIYKQMMDIQNTSSD